MQQRARFQVWCRAFNCISYLHHLDQFFYCQFQELNLWVPHSVVSNVLHSRGKESSATVIIDCTEVQINKPKNPLSHQQSYSNYKILNTVKVLVGLSETGTVTFVSEAYGGSTSDRQVFERSGLLQKLEANDVVVAGRGFNIQDLLLRRNFRLDIPDFVPQKGQLEQKQLYRSNNLSFKRIHVKRVIGLGKTYKILTGPITFNLVSLSSRIIFVCFMLVKFRPNIMS